MFTASTRFVEVAFYEWPFYSAHPSLIPAFWLGGMATHGLLVGGLIGIWTFASIYRKPFLQITDALAIPAAVIMGLGLYDGIKNLLIVPVLLALGDQLPRGVRTGVFLFLYAFLRIFVDVFREYPTTLLGLAAGQVLNLAMSLVGLALIIVPLRRARAAAGPVREPREPEPLAWRPALLAAILVFSLVIPSDWTQDVPARYGVRHPGLQHSPVYPKLDTSPAH